MKVEIKKHTENDTKVTIACKDATPYIKSLKKHIEAFDEKIVGKHDGEEVFAPLSDILYFEAVNNHTFFYTKDGMAETSKRLYELEDFLPKEDFFRCSKSMIIHVNKIKSLRPELNRTILVTMCNNEKLYISRRYAVEFKKLLNL